MTRANRPNTTLRVLGVFGAAAAMTAVPGAALTQAPSSAQARSAAPSPPLVQVRYDAPPPDAVERGLALRKLGTTKSVLMIGAHPDDENTAVLAALALGQGADVAYLSLTRGEGGQNGIGPEQQEALGLVRTEELLAARDVDRGRQFFTRAYDFGFSKNADEAFQHWPQEELLEDVVRVVRSFRPDVMVAVFTGTPSDGHGQHQASGIMAREAFEAAADPSRFPDAGAPHAATALYRARFRGTDGADLALETGALDPLLGRSHHQIAMASRSEHRSQDMGQAQGVGPREVGLDRVASRVGADAPASLFAGVDTTLAQQAGALTRGFPELRPVAAALEEYGSRVGAADAASGGDAILAELLRAEGALAGALRLLEPAAETGGGPRDLLRSALRERVQLHAAALLAAGVAIDVRAEDATVVPGQTFSLSVSVWNGGRAPVLVRDVAPDLPPGWTAVERDAVAAAGSSGDGVAPGGDGARGAVNTGAGPPEPLAPGAVLERTFRVSVPADAEASIPYFLLDARRGDRYVWRREELAGEAFEPDPVRGVVTIDLDPGADGDDARSGGGAASVSVSRAASFVDVDKTIGEYRLPVLVVPGVSVALAPGVALVPASAPRPVDFSVRVTSNEPEAVAGAASLGLPPGWRSEPVEVPLQIEPGATGLASFTVTPPSGVAPDEYAVAGLFRGSDGRTVETGVDVIDYPHIRPRLLPTRARAVLQVLDVAVPPGLSVAYVEGAGDGGAAALEQLGIDHELLGPEDLAAGDLDRFDTIVLGIRAYEFRPDVAANNARLLDYVRAGGTLIVQYNKYELPQGGFAPYPLTMSRPHDRVTDEAAEVTILDPEHPLFTWPNPIGPRDFEGWVQERGLYFAGTWDDRYEPLLEMADPGEAPLRGSTLIAPLGDGTYVYTALSLFRQLPAGVPGAYRLLANLVALGADRESS